MSHRILAKLDIKHGKVIKGVEFEGVRQVGDPIELAKKYYKEQIDEIIYLDCVASLYNRSHLIDLLPMVSEQVFVPICAGGGIKNFDNAKKLFDNGADKIAINTGAVKNPIILKKISDFYGRQAVVLQIDCKKNLENQWEVYIDYGRQKTGIDVFNWIEKALKMGVGEIIATAIDKDGKQAGFDYDLYKKLSSNFDIPIIACGGAGNFSDIYEIFKIKSIRAVCISSIFHYNLLSPAKLKKKLKLKGIPVR
jgi:cyclase